MLHLKARRLATVACAGLLAIALGVAWLFAG